MNAYVTADKIGIETGGGSVTYNELESLKKVGNVQVINPPSRNNPFETDIIAMNECNVNYKLAHFYAGTFTKTIAKLKSNNVKITYTKDAHDVDISREEFEKLGIPFDFPHLNDPKLFNEYLEGYRQADVVICPSETTKRVAKKYGCKNVAVIPHGCHLPNNIAPLPQKFMVGYLGQPGPDKGLIYLIKAWALLNYKDSQLIIAGRNVNYLLPIIREYGKGSIYLAGEVKYASDLYNVVSVYCQSSCTEGFGLEVIEALSYGRPVICSDGAGAVDCITHEVDGKVVPKRNPEAIAEAINDYKNNPDKIKEHGRFAIEKSKNYTWEKVRQMYYDLWKNLIGG